MILYYIRHGQSANNANFDATGADLGRVVDPELTPTGVRQAAQVAELLRCGQPLLRSRAEAAPGFGVTHLYCSLMTRAAHTGAHIARALNLPLQGWKEIHETGGMFLEDPATKIKTGYPGATREALCSRFPELVWPDGVDPAGWWNRPFEERTERPARARAVLDELLLRHGGKDDRVALVSHGGFYYRLMCTLLGHAQDDSLWFHMYNTAVSCIEFNGDEGTTIRYLNRTDHLPAELIT
jgi:2,3-bisphosphoglycerate-dependent phosphoglycerate mutase